MNTESQLRPSSLLKNGRSALDARKTGAFEALYVGRREPTLLLQQVAKWNNRAFTSLLVTAMFLVLAVSGCVRYFAPRCRDANWGGWNVLGLGKDEWVTMHMASAVMFLIIAAVHVVLNWQVLLSYLRTQRGGGLRHVREAGGAVGITAVVVILSAAMLPPASSLAGFAEGHQEQFALALKPVAPWRHAEDTPLAEFAGKLNVPLKSVLASLNTGDRPAHAEDTLRDVARWRDTTPAALYRQLRHGLGQCEGRNQPPRSGDDE
ncbi:MAG TPA: DUF4405 domain-containing protein [Phycisphaerae bacterium]|nr:DUF4405 domain-containing protein [Phycisphaerae bacterium]HNU46662.1 DUF4405 domain-containing protein [Phycisphaerae bacterium]